MEPMGRCEASSFFGPWALLGFASSHRVEAKDGRVDVRDDIPWSAGAPGSQAQNATGIDGGSKFLSSPFIIRVPFFLLFCFNKETPK